LKIVSLVMDVFTRPRAASPVPSDVGDDDVVGVSGAASSRLPAGSKGVFHKDTTVNLKGRGRVKYDPRKYKYDVLRGQGANLPFEATKDDRMSAADAGEMLHRLHVTFGVDRETEAVLNAFDRAVFFCHTVNGGSTLMPGRSVFSVPGQTAEFSFATVRDVLGVDQRRFFRAYADDIAEVNLQVLRDYDPYDPVKAEQWGWLVSIAEERGLSRYPQLCHDSADACLRLSVTERAAVAASKALVISTSNNSADRLKTSGRVQSADKYDSTVGAVV